MIAQGRRPMSKNSGAVLTGLVAAAVVGIIALRAWTDSAHSQDAPAPAVVRADFAPDGSVKLPVGYRKWAHVGTRFKPDGLSILDELPLTVPEIMNAYVEPSAMAYFERTGTWPDGSQIVKEMSAIQTGGGCDPVTHICKNLLGAGIFEANYMGLGMMVKDSERFPETPGHWGYFSFGHKAPPYEATSLLRSPQQCASCHMRLASDTDYVIARAHLGLADKAGN